MPTLFKKIILSFLTFVILFVSIAPFLSIKAQTPSPAPAAHWYSPGLFEFYNKVYDTNNNDIFGERYTYAQVVWILESLPFALMGVLPDYYQAVLLEIAQSNQTGANPFSNPNNKLAQLKDPFLSIINQFYLAPPASGTRWLTQKINNFSIVKHAYAQTGFGYNSLAMFQKLWQASRDIAFLIMILILVSIAFAIMFRVKINPQVAVTIQNSLPKIATTLILIIFSYAIVGFLIDLMYLIFGVLVYAITSSGASSADPAALFKDFTNGHILKKVFTSMNSSVVTTGAGAGLGIIGIVIALISYAGTVSGAAALALPMLPFILGIIIAIFLFFFKTFLMLAQTYFSLIINLAFGPLIILAEAIPFVKASAMGWLKSVIADVLVFLTVGLIFVIADLLNNAFSVTGVATWSPPYLPFSPFFFKLIIWVAVWSLLPNVKDMVYKMMEKSSLNVQTPSEFRGQGEKLWESIMRVKGKMSTNG